MARINDSVVGFKSILLYYLLNMRFFSIYFCLLHVSFFEGIPKKQIHLHMVFLLQRNVYGNEYICNKWSSYLMLLGNWEEALAK